MKQLQASSARKWLGRPMTIVLVALAARIGVMLWIHAYNFPANDDNSFHNETTLIAYSLASGQGFSSPFGGSTGPTAAVPPIYPALCAIIFRVLGSWSVASAITILVMNSIFSALTCLPILDIGRRVGGELTGQLSAWMWAIMPFFMEWPLTWAWDVALTTLCAALMVQQTLNLKEGGRGSPRHWAWVGVLFGVSLLVNPAVATIILLALWWLRYAGVSWKRIITLALVCFVTIIPWTLRNRIVFGQWVFLRSNFALEFETANFHGSPGSSWSGRYPCCNPAEYAKYKQMGELAYIHMRAQRAKIFLRQYPREFIHLCGKRFVMVWDGTTFRALPAQVWLPWLFLPLSLGGCLGFLFLWRDKSPDTTFLFLTTLLFPWPYYITHIQTRFRAPIEPLLLVANVYLLLSFYWLGRRMISKWQQKASANGKAPV